MVQRFGESGSAALTKKPRKVPQRLRSDVALKRLMDKELSKCLGWKTFQPGETPVLFEASWKKSEVFQGLRFYGTEIQWDYKCGDKYAKIFAQNLKVWIIT